LAAAPPATIAAQPWAAADPAAATAAPAWEFREARDEDAGLAAELLELKCVFDRSLSGEPPSTIKPSAGRSLASLFPELGPSGKMLLVDDAAGQGRHEDRGRALQDLPVGFALYQLRYYGLDAPPSLWLEDIYVDGARRSQGAGLALMRELGRVGRRNFCSHLGWKCHVDNDRGNRFYERIGALVQSQKGDMYNYRWAVPPSAA
jgi:GNAT superfamily N-acetyltransferase